MSDHEKRCFDQGGLIIQDEFGGAFWRNNSGACYDDTGRLVRFGLGNDSAKLWETYKTGDQVFCVPVTIQPHHVGRVFGVMGMFEDKKRGWHLTAGDKRGHAQLNALQHVQSLGGIVGFITEPDQVRKIIQDYIDARP